MLRAERRQVEWQTLTAKAKRIHKAMRPQQESWDFDYDRDLVYHAEYFTDVEQARRFARKIIKDGVSFFGATTIQRQVVDFFVEEDRVAEWTDAGDREEIP